MKAIMAKVLDDHHLELSETITVPVGSSIRIGLDVPASPLSYSQRLKQYYDQCPPKALREESAMAESLCSADAPLPPFRARRQMSQE